jgi:hypothetical protein
MRINKTIREFGKPYRGAIRALIYRDNLGNWPNRIILNVFENLDLYNNLTFANKKYFQIGNEYKQRIDSTNHLWTLIEKFPNENWDWNSILKNLNTNLMQLWHEDRPWDQNMILLRSNVNLNVHIWMQNDSFMFISSKIRICFPESSVKYLYANPNISWWDIEANPQIFHNHKYIVNNKYLPIKKLMKFELNEKLCSNKNLTIEILNQYPMRFTCEWRLQKNPSIIEEFIVTNLRKIFDCENIQMDHWNDFEEYLSNIRHRGQMPSKYDLNKFFDEIIYNAAALNSIILKNGDLIKNIAWNENITKNLTAEWFYVSKHKLITWQIVQAFPRNPWNYLGLMQNSNILPEFIKANQDLFAPRKWNLAAVSRNPNLTAQFVCENAWPWNFFEISKNKFDANKI